MQLAVVGVASLVSFILAFFGCAVDISHARELGRESSSIFVMIIHGLVVEWNERGAERDTD